jgi:hypothetical protein
LNDLSVIGGKTRAVHFLSEPSRFWIAYSPRSWRSCNRPFTDLANMRLGGFGRSHSERDLPDLETDDVEDLLYLPPVDPDLAAARDDLARKLLDQGVALLVQLRPGEKTEVKGVTIVFDLIEPLLRGEVQQINELEAGSQVVWPLISGLTDHPESWEEGLELLRSRQVGVVQALVPELSPPVRRQLAERYGDQAFDALFHGDTPSERRFAQAVSALGLGIFINRPLTGLSLRQQSNRQIAAKLALAGELWHRMEKPIAAGQGLLRAARGAESSQHDLAALVRENNLKVMDWLDVPSFDMIRQLVRDDRSSLLEILSAEYLGRPPEPWATVAPNLERERVAKVIQAGDDDDDEDDEDI